MKTDTQKADEYALKASKVSTYRLYRKKAPRGSLKHLTTKEWKARANQISREYAARRKAKGLPCRNYRCESYRAMRRRRYKRRVEAGWRDTRRRTNRCLDREKVKARNKRQTLARKKSPYYKLRRMVQLAIRDKFRTKGLRKDKCGVFRLLGYSFDELKVHLEKQFKEGMTWENRGKDWHIDHIIPDCSFRYISVNDEGFKNSWALSNLQPLWKEENLKKGARLTQPVLMC